MAIKRKSSKKVYIAIFLLIVLIAATGAIVYSYPNWAQNPPAKEVTPGVNVGDTFTYSIHSTSNLIGLDAVEPAGFSQYNDTDYYKVTITGVNGSTVSMDSIWRFINGTERNYQQTINIANGLQTNQYTGFWAIYAPNLNLNDKVRPSGNDGLIVNSTDTETYADSTRQRNCWSLQNDFFDVNDPTYSTLQRKITTVFFDKETGMLETLSDVQRFNNPAMDLVITWKLVSSSVWAV
jgi:hypothetical protein